MLTSAGLIYVAVVCDHVFVTCSVYFGKHDVGLRVAGRGRTNGALIHSVFAMLSES